MISYLRMRWHQWVLCRLLLHDWDGWLRSRLSRVGAPRAMYERCIWCDVRRPLL